MKILYVTRLFSGLESSFHQQVWNPTGVPTIYRMIEELDKHHDMRFLFTARDSGKGYCSTWLHESDSENYIDGLNHAVLLVAGKQYFPHWMPHKVAIMLRNFRQIMKVLIEAIRFNPELVYCDHANIIAGALLAHILRNTPVVFRAMGVYPFMRDVLISVHPVYRLYRWSYRAPFALVICTQDGSGVESWLQQALRYGVATQVLLNGTDKPDMADMLNDQLISVSEHKMAGKLLLLYVGKLERYKGCYLFVEAVLKFRKRVQRGVHALVVGTGSEEEALHRVVKESNADGDFTFIKRLPHNQVIAAHHLSDIYVSMNSLGNLSNANLEAIEANDCMIIPQAQPEMGIDVVTEELLHDSVVRVPYNNAAALTRAMIQLSESPAKRRVLRQRLEVRKRLFLWSWAERIDNEMLLLQGLVDRRFLT